ncbi:MAG TPA: hypothetical protein VIG06_13365 [Kofleriaceae bacterium]|jgi:hypothetical protein
MNRGLAVALPLAVLLACGDDDGGGGADAGGGDPADGGGDAIDGATGTDAAIDTDADPCAPDGCGAVAEITFPADGAITAEEVDVAFTVDGAATRAECTVDSVEVACEPGTLPVTLGGGEHTVTVQAFDASDAGGPVDSVTWTVDAAPPIVTAVTSTDLATGSVRVSYTVADESAVLRIRCAIDGGPRVACGTGDSGSRRYDELGPGPHTVDVDAIDEWGHSGGAAASAPPPSAHASLTFDVVLGPGHLIVIGDDYADPFGPVSQLDRLLFNAFAQSAAMSFDRPLRVAAVTEGASDEEIQHLETYLDLSIGPVVVTLDFASLAEGVSGVDVLLIPDQNGSSSPFGVAPLSSFLDAGGVVILLEGTFDDGGGETPSYTLGLLDPGLLAISAAETYDGCADVPCNADDPLLIDVQPPVCLTGAVGFETAEPWVTLDYAGDSSDLPIVLHRWFGDPAAGPVAISTGDGGQSSGGLPVRFQDAAGSDVATCETVPNGSAVHQMGADASLSVLQSDGMLTTAVAVQPLEHVDLRGPAPVASPAISIEVDLDDTPGFSYYRLISDCGDVVSDTPGAIPIAAACRGEVFNLVAEAYDASDRIVGYAAGAFSDPGGAPIEMPAWRLANFTPAISTGSLPGVAATELSVTLHANGSDYLERGDVADPTVYSEFYAPVGPLDPLFDLMTHTEAARFTVTPSSYEPISTRRVSGPLLTSLNVDLSSVLLPRLTGVATSFDGEDRLTILWTAQGPLVTADGEIATLVWFDGASLHVWRVLFPPAEENIAPPPPAPDSPLFDAWPELADDPTLVRLELDDASFASGYRDYLRRIGDVFRPPATQHTLRTTELLLAP